MLSEPDITKKIAKTDHRFGLHVRIFCGKPKKKIDPDLFLTRVEKYQISDTMRMSVTYPDHVGVAHESILLALLHIAERQGHADAILDGDLRDLEGDASSRDIWWFQTTAHEILTVLGMAISETAYARLERQLEDLSRIHLKMTGRRGGVEAVTASTILGYTWIRSGRQKISIRLCWRFAAMLAMSDPKNRKFVQIDLNERMQLSDTAKSLHVWISSHCWAGNAQRYTVDGLTEKAFRGPAETESTSRRRRQLIRSAMSELGVLPGWTVSAGDGGRVYRVTRK